MISASPLELVYQFTPLGLIYLFDFVSFVMEIDTVPVSGLSHKYDRFVLFLFCFRYEHIIQTHIHVRNCKAH